MSRAVALILAAALVGCGAHPPPPVTTAPIGPVASSVGSVRVLRARRATDGHVAVGLFVRAREGSAALRATAALVIEARGQGRWRVRATPDGLVVHTAAETSALDATLGSLAAALDVRQASRAEVASALDHVRRRRAARASDDAALATQLALEALGGVSVDPFGASQDDADVTSDAVSAWLARTMGAERMLVAVVGDVEDGTLRAAIGGAFAHVPHVAEADVEASWVHGTARAAVGTHPTAAAATSVGSLDEAARIADWIERLLPEAHAVSFPLRGRAVVSATLAGDERALASLAEAFRHARALDDEAAHAEARDAQAELLALGDAWLATLTGETDDALGLALVRTNEGDVPPSSDATLDRFAAGHDVTPTQLDDARAEAVLESGMRIRVARGEGDAVAVALSWAAGARFDPPREHGRSALLSRVLARSCEPDADESWADDATFGVVIRGERTTVERTALRAIDCARRAVTEVAHTEGVRAAAIGELGVEDRVRAWAAGVLAPGAPGLVAPRGSAVGLAAGTQLEEAIDGVLDPRRATLTIVADEAPARLLAIADALGSALHAGTEALATAPTSVPEGAREAFVTDPQLDVAMGVVALRTDAGASDRGARYVANALAAALSARALAVRGFLGASATGMSFAVVVVTGPDDRLDALPAIAAQSIASITVDEAVSAGDVRDRHERALALAEPAVLARSLAAEGIQAPAADVANALLHASIHTVLARPTSGPLRRTR